LAPGWNDYGWAPRKISGGPARLNFSSYGGWIIARPELRGAFGGLVFRVRAPSEYGDFLEVRVDSPREEVFPRVKPTAAHRRDLPDGWVEIWIPMEELNPQDARFDRIIIRAYRAIGPREIELDAIALTAPGESAGSRGSDAPPRPVKMAIDCAAATHAIHPMIYGIAFSPMRDATDAHQWQLGATARRWGGNPSSRYNWELGNAWNTANDWFFRNVNYTGIQNYSYDMFLEDNLARNVKTALTVPTIGWVAKDTSSYSFPAAVFGEQQTIAPENADIGNGKAKDGKAIAPGSPRRTSVPAPPASIARWVRAIREKDRRRGRSVQMYILDNEPMLWNSTHRDVHPEAVSYDELLTRTLEYATAIRRSDPDAVIAGPAEWGWPNYFYSAVDAEKGFASHPDRVAHGNEPLIAWWLRRIREYEKGNGLRLLDVLDLHFYPQGQGMASGTNGATDAQSAALRIRSTRGLWDPTYVDESWIKEPVRLLPRMREWIVQNHPGLGIAIGEWSFGAEEHMSGGLAVAEALGRFGAFGIDAAFYWDYPAKNSPAFWAFRAYRNFDGKGGRFLDESLQAKSEDSLSSIFASRGPGGDHFVAILLNLDPSVPAAATVDLSTCGKVEQGRTFTFARTSESLTAGPSLNVDTPMLQQRLPPYSITVVDFRLKTPKKNGP
jgi:hypothetical protein